MVKDNSKTFSDVPDNYWGKDAIAFVTARELFNGISDDQFAPAAPMTRAMLVTVLHRLEDTPAAKVDAAFPDVDAAAWYADAVAWASGNGIVTGTGSGFEPDGRSPVSSSPPSSTATPTSWVWIPPPPVRSPSSPTETRFPPGPRRPCSGR